MEKVYFEDNYNPVILKDIESEENLAICSSLGSGKSTSVKKYISMNPDKKILLVVNKKDNQKEFKKDLPTRLIYVDSDSRIKLKEATRMLYETPLNCVCITKVRFNYMVTVNTKLFDGFDKIIIDESNGINPIIQDRFDDSLKGLLETLGNILKLMDDEGYNDGKELLDFLYELNAKFIREKKVTKMLQLDVDDKYRKLALSLKNSLLALYEDDKINEHNIHKVFGMLNSIIDNQLHFNEYNSSKGKQSSILFCNRFLRNFIKEKGVSVKVLDGTAKFLEPLYTWLGIKIKDEYKENLAEYPNMKIHYYKFNDVTPFEGRSNTEVKEKMLQFIEKENIPEDFLLFTDKSSSEVFGEKFRNTRYAFSGDDVGSNEFMDEENLIVVFYNTLPQSFRLLYNKEIKGMDIKKASSTLELEIAEYELVGSMMVQLVGRTAIRKDNNANVNIYMFCVPPTTARSIQHHYKIPRENIKVYEASLDLRKKVNLAVSGLFYLLEMELKKGIENIDILEIAKEYYGERLTKDTIKNIKRNKDKFKEFEVTYGLTYNTRGKLGWSYCKV